MPTPWRSGPRDSWPRRLVKRKRMQPDAVHRVRRARREVGPDFPEIEALVVAREVVVLDGEVAVFENAVGNEEVVRLVARETDVSRHLEADDEGHACWQEHPKRHTN